MSRSPGVFSCYCTEALQRNIGSHGATARTFKAGIIPIGGMSFAPDGWVRAPLYKVDCAEAGLGTHHSPGGADTQEQASGDMGPDSVIAGLRPRGDINDANVSRGRGDRRLTPSFQGPYGDLRPALRAAGRSRPGSPRSPSPGQAPFLLLISR